MTGFELWVLGLLLGFVTGTCLVYILRIAK